MTAEGWISFIVVVAPRGHRRRRVGRVLVGDLLTEVRDRLTREATPPDEDEQDGDPGCEEVGAR